VRSKVRSDAPAVYLGLHCTRWPGIRTTRIIGSKEDGEEIFAPDLIAQGNLWDRVVATFETYWEDHEFEPYHLAERPRLKRALEEERSVESSGPEPFPYELRPWAFQQSDGSTTSGLASCSV